MNRITKSTNFSEDRLDLCSNFQTRARPLEVPAAEVRTVPGDRPSLLFKRTGEDGRFEVGQLLSLRIEISEPELELSIDARVSHLSEKPNEQLISAYPVRHSADLLSVLAHYSKTAAAEHA